MSRRRIGLLLLTVLLVILAAGVLLAHQAWQDWRRTQGIERVQWQRLDWSPHGLSIARLELLQRTDSHELDLILRNLDLSWRWSWRGPVPQDLRVGQLEADWRARPGPESEALETDPPEIPRDLAPWLPQSFVVESFALSVPCRTGSCALEGRLDIARDRPGLLPLGLEVELERAGHVLRLQGELTGELADRIRYSDLKLAAALEIDGVRYLKLNSRYHSQQKAPQQEGQARLWSGELNMPELPRNDWLLDWLREWQPVPESPLPPGRQAGSLRALWQLQADLEEAVFEPIRGQVSLAGRLPEPWPLPGLGALQGEVDLDVALERGQWRADALQADLRLSQPGSWVELLPGQIRPVEIMLTISPAEPMPGITSGSSLPLRLKLDTTGAGEMHVDAHLALTGAAPWAAAIGPSRISLDLPELGLAGWRARDNSAELAMTGSLDQQSLRLSLGDASYLRIAHLDGPGEDQALWFDGLRGDLGGTVLTGGLSSEGELERLTLAGPVEIAARRLRYPVLLSQPWNFQGELDVDLGRLMLSGLLAAESGLQANLGLSKPFDGPLAIEASSRVVAEDGIDELAGLIAAWPDSLTTDAGTISAGAELTLPPEGELRIQGQLAFDRVSGLYDRAAWTGLEGTVGFAVSEAMLNVQAEDVAVEQVNPGVPIGPIQLAADYRAPVARWQRGSLELEQARASFLGGRVRIEPGSWDLSEMPLRIPVYLKDIDLSELMAVYPAEGLEGTGTLNGRLPVIVTDEGVSLGQGQVSAAPPGGVLKLPVERIRAIARDNPALEMVAQAMENFHYTVLNSQVQYDQDGTLVLDLRLEGRNPDFREGQPIHLNIRLEEDIPALLMSLQLSGRVSDAVTERVKQWLRSGGAEGEGVDVQ